MTPEMKAMVERIVKHLNDYNDDPKFFIPVAMTDLADYLVENGLADCTSSSGFSVKQPEAPDMPKELIDTDIPDALPATDVLEAPVLTVETLQAVADVLNAHLDWSGAEVHAALNRLSDYLCAEGLLEIDSDGDHNIPDDVSPVFPLKVIVGITYSDADNDYTLFYRGLAQLGHYLVCEGSLDLSMSNGYTVPGAEASVVTFVLKGL
jgi:hypothetical protein